VKLLFLLLILLVLTRLFGELAERLGQPALVGELISGVLLGILAAQTDLVPLLDGIAGDEVFVAITELAVFFLMLLAGVETRSSDLVRSSRRALLVALGGMFLPLGLGMAAGWALLPDSPFRAVQAVFFGTALAITAVPVTVRILEDLGKLRTGVGQTILAAALFDDILSLLLLAVLTGYLKAQSLSGVAILLVLGKVALFFAITLPVGWWVFPQVGRRLKNSRVAEAHLSGLLIAALAYAVLADALGLHAIVGAFVAGVFFERRVVDRDAYDRVEQQLSGLTSGFLAPVFFASIGLHVDVSAVRHAPLLLMTLIALAFFGKIVGAGLPAYWVGMSRRDAWTVGIAMSGRGTVELVIADVAMRAGLFDVPDPPPSVVRHLFSAVVVMALVTTVLTPILLRRLLRDLGSRGLDMVETDR